MTWGETATRNFRFNGRRDKKVAAPARTSNDLLGGGFIKDAPPLLFLQV
ncbi:MAG: hypothetical protein M3521_10400 [Acidobacteriota bacterium]|nr:hypothetical protein [Acidobacteriota bacterium]